METAHLWRGRVVCEPCRRRLADGPPVDAAPGPAVSGLALASLICGVCSYPCLCGSGVVNWLGLAIAAVAVILGALALRRIRREPDRFRGRGLALAGIVAGAAALALFGAVMSYIYSDL